jgi:hypothetical protein
VFQCQADPTVWNVLVRHERKKKPAAEAPAVDGEGGRGMSDDPVDGWAIEPEYDEPHDHTVRFLTRFEPDGAFTFQVFDDAKQDRVRPAIFHGTLGKWWRELTRLNALGAGIYVMANEGDGQGRRAENVIRIRAVFVDLDGAPLQPVLNAVLKPHLLVETSPGRFHAIWLVSDCRLDQFTGTQKALAARFGGDPAVIDLPRVVRLPGFWHMKDRPQLSRLLCEHFAPPYALADIVAGLGLKMAEPAPRRPVVAAPRYSSELTPYCKAALLGAYRAICTAPDEHQEKTLSRESFAMGQLVAHWGMPADRAIAALRDAAMRMPSYKAPWTPAEIDRKISNRFAAGLLRPRPKTERAQ